MSIPAILIRVDTQEILKDGQYPRNDLEPVIGLDPNLQWLIKVYNDRPVYNEATQIAEYEWVKDLVNGQYVKTWTVRSRTQQELLDYRESVAAMKDEELPVDLVKKLLRKTALTLTEDEQVEYAGVFPTWKPGLTVAIDERYQHEGLLYKVVQAHTTQLDWAPDVATSLFTRVAPPNVIPVWVQPTGSHDAYNTGDQVYYPTENDSIYESLIDANTWSPAEYPAGWQTV